jgi:hypothetical protein
MLDDLPMVVGFEGARKKISWLGHQDVLASLMTKHTGLQSFPDNEEAHEANTS